VVEDAPTYRALLGIRLDAEGWDVRWAGTAEEGLEIVEEQGCDAILSDLNLPGMSGDALLEIVHKRYPGVALFLMTAAPKERWPKVPPSIPIYPKPVDMDLLMKRLKTLAASAKRPGGKGGGLPR
jgi:DNA-binding NtrC family response regulator